jgi:F-type H+-transporting ATPase subunit epsilon
MATLRVELVAADQAVWTGEAKMVVAKTVEGEIGLLPGHEPMLAILGAGEVRITLEDGNVIKANAEDGFLSVENNVVAVVARNASLVRAGKWPADGSRCERE